MSNFLRTRDDSAAVVQPLDGSETQTVEPGKACNWYLIGTPGESFSVQLVRIAYSGGHNHAGGPTGKVAPSTGTIGPNGSTKIEYVAPDASGTVRLETTIGGVRVADDFVSVSVSGLVAILSSPSLSLIGATSRHQNNHFGHPALVRILGQLASAYYAKFSRPLYVNDASLASGGLFDINGDWKNPHLGHQRGTNVDIRSVGLTQGQYNFVRTKALELGFAVLPETSPPHFHLTLSVRAEVIQLWDQTQLEAHNRFSTMLHDRSTALSWAAQSLETTLVVNEIMSVKRSAD